MEDLMNPAFDLSFIPFQMTKPSALVAKLSKHFSRVFFFKIGKIYSPAVNNYSNPSR
jgi:hypothetical protein